MGDIKETLTFDLGKYVTIEEFVEEELFWNDCTIYFENGTYIHNANKDCWYQIDFKFHYADFGTLFNEKYTVTFSLLDKSDVDTINELNQQFLED